MNTTSSAVLTGAIVYGGRWAEGKTIDIRAAIGVAGIALFLSIMAQNNAKLAQQFGLLILVAASFKYVPPLVKGLNLDGKKKAK